MSSIKDIADYYDQTLNHYQLHWKLDSSKALHYGLWYKNTKKFSEALENTNKKIVELGNVSTDQKILDAGCGVGGTAIYIASNFNCEVNGITLSEKQLSEGKNHIERCEVQDRVKIDLMNFEQTNFADNTFDLVYGIESICHSKDKEKFLNEALRIIKPEGRLIVIDFFQNKEALTRTEQKLMTNWLSRWAVNNLSMVGNFESKAKNIGFNKLKTENLTPNIVRSSKKLYQAALLGSIPSKLYSKYNNKVSRFSRDHYKSGLYQYKALKQELWNYSALVLKK